MKKRTARLGVPIVLALAACNLSAETTSTSTGSAAGGGDAAVTVTTIKVADNWGATHPMAAALDNVFKPAVEEASGGALKVEVYHSGTLGNEADLWDGVRNGTIDLAIVGTPMNQEYSTMLISDWPFLYRDLDHAKKVWTGDIGEEVATEFHEKFPTVYLLGWGPNSARTFTSNKPLTSVEEFAGQKFRMPSNPIHVGIVENLGASAQVIPLGELFSALETGVVDGQDNGMVTVISEGFYEVQKYIYETNHIIATLEIMASASFLDGLSADQQEIIRDAAKEASAQAWDDYIASVDTDRQTLKDKGLTVTELTDADRDLIIEKIKPLTDQLYAENDWAQALTDKIKAVN
jgi:tripartite ATP-independent transporter DctP family solute receptor